MSETNEPDYAGHTQGAVQSCHGSNYVDDATQQYTIARFVGNSREEERANAALFVAAADTETGYVATLAKLAAMEQERDDWERRAFAAGEELAEVRADRDDWKKLAAIWRDKRLVEYGLKQADDAPEVAA